MMKALRKNYKLILWGIAIFTIPAFIWWGAGSASNSKPGQGYAGQIEHWKVTIEEYTSIYQNLEQNLSKVFGPTLKAALLEDFTWTRLLLFHEAKKRKILVSDQEVRDRIAQLPHFQKEGHFDPANYQLALGNRARQFEEQIRQDLILERLRTAVISNVVASEEEIRKAFTEENEKIKLGYTFIETNPAAEKKEEPLGPYGTSLETEPPLDPQKARETAKNDAQSTHEEIQNKINQGIPVKEAFAGVTNSVTETDPINRKATLEIIGYQPGFLEKVFQTEEGKLGEIVEIPTGFVLFWVDKKLLPDEKLYASEKSTYQQRVLDKKQEEAFSTWLTDLKSKTPIKKYLADLKN